MDLWPRLNSVSCFIATPLCIAGLVSRASFIRTGLRCFGPTVYCSAGGPHWRRGARQNLRSWDRPFHWPMCWWNRLRRVAFSLYVAQSPLNATPTCVGGSCPTKQVKPVVRCPPSFKSTQLSSSSCRWGWASPSRAIWLLYRFVSNCLRATLPSFRMMCILWPPPRPRFLQNNLNLPSSRKLLASGWTKAGISTRISFKGASSQPVLGRGRLQEPWSILSRQTSPKLLGRGGSPDAREVLS